MAAMQNVDRQQWAQSGPCEPDRFTVSRGNLCNAENVDLSISDHLDKPDNPICVEGCNTPAKIFPFRAWDWSITTYRYRLCFMDETRDLAGAIQLFDTKISILRA